MTEQAVAATVDDLVLAAKASLTRQQQLQDRMAKVSAEVKSQPMPAASQNAPT